MVASVPAFLAEVLALGETTARPLLPCEPWLVNKGLPVWHKRKLGPRPGIGRSSRGGQQLMFTRFYVVKSDFLLYFFIDVPSAQCSVIFKIYTPRNSCSITLFYGLKIQSQGFPRIWSNWTSPSLGRLPFRLQNIPN